MFFSAGVKYILFSLVDPHFFKSINWNVCTTPGLGNYTSLS